MVLDFPALARPKVRQWPVQGEALPGGPAQPRLPWLIVWLVVLLGGCSHSRMRVVPFGLSDYEAAVVPADSVLVFSGEDRILTTYRRIARLSVGPKYWTNPTWDAPSIETALVERAAELGANGVVLGEISGFPYEGPDGADTWGTAVAVRLDVHGPGKPDSFARFPRDIGALAVAPLSVPEDITLPDSVLEAFVHDLHQELLGAGLTPLPPGTYESVSPEDVEELKRLLDPRGSAAVVGSAHSGDRSVRRRLVEEFGVEGFLVPHLQWTEAHFEGDEASWDGVEQKVGKTRSLGARVTSGILNALIRGEDASDESEYPPEGSVWALSLVVQIENTLGALLFTGRGGFELMEKADFEGGIWIGDPEPEEYEIVEVPAEKRFQRRGRVLRAVRTALSPLRREE